MDGAKKRLFFALWPDDDTRQSIVTATNRVVVAAGGRAVKPQNVHITLAFLHAVETRLMDCIEAAAARAACDPFVLTLSQLGYWKRSRILWLGPGDDMDRGIAAAGALARALWQELAVCGFQPEQRRYQPHVTLARKAASPAAAVNVAAVRWPVRSFALVESLSGQRGANYRVLKTFPMTRDDGISR